MGWGECNPKRKVYRNGFYSRDLLTSSGRIKDLQVPRDREGQFHTQVFDRYSRYEPQVAQGLTEMFVAGVSTHKVGEVIQTLMRVAPSANAISRLSLTLTQQFETWRERPPQEHWHVLYLDGVHFSFFGWSDSNARVRFFSGHDLFWRRRLASEAQGVTLLVLFAEARKGAQSAISMNVVPTLLGV